MPLIASEKFLAQAAGTVTTYNDTVGGQALNTMVTVNFGAGTGAGTLVAEVADDAAYAGTWAVLATITWAAASKIGTALIAGPWKALRLRWTANVTGGTADVSIQINK